MSDLGDDWPPVAPARPLWLMTLADLALLLVGFFVLVQASGLDRTALATGLRAGFAAPPPTAMPVAAAAVAGFAPGSAALPDTPAAAIGWARDVARDPRVRLTVSGSVDPAERGGALLAADRARAVAAALVAADAVAADRLILTTTAAPDTRAVRITLSYAGAPR